MTAKNLVGLLTGLLFGFGLALAGMTQPEKVLGFLDVAGRWDPSLLFVLGGAVGVTVVSFHFILRRKTPLLDTRYYFSEKMNIDRSLILGAALFGIGWGIGGYCPGPAVTLLAAPSWELWAFLPAMLLGIFVEKLMAAARDKKPVTVEVAEQNDCS
jgi:uncharacterized membrane protein YedE/YeeE